MASLAKVAGFPSYPLSNTGTSKHLPCVLSYSTAPLLKLSHAAKSTENPLFLKRYATLANVVDFPTPLTPTKIITKGLPSSFFFIA